MTGSVEWLQLAGSLVLMVVLRGFVLRTPRVADLDIRIGVRNGLIVAAAIAVAVVIQRLVAQLVGPARGSRSQATPK